MDVKLQEDIFIRLSQIADLRADQINTIAKGFEKMIDLVEKQNREMEILIRQLQDNLK
jgi:hypothetical protein